MRTDGLVFVGILLVTLCFAGCGEPKSDTTEATTSGGDKKSVTVKGFQEDLGQAAETARDLAEQTKDEYLRAFDRRLEELDQSIENVKTEGDERADGARNNGKIR